MQYLLLAIITEIYYITNTALFILVNLRTPEELPDFNFDFMEFQFRPLELLYSTAMTVVNVSFMTSLISQVENSGCFVVVGLVVHFVFNLAYTIVSDWDMLPFRTKEYAIVIFKLACQLVLVVRYYQMFNKHEKEKKVDCDVAKMKMESATLLYTDVIKN